MRTEQGLLMRLTEAILDEMRKRVLLVRAVSVLLTGFLVMCLLPHLAALFEGLYLYLSWPLIAVAGAGYFTFAGFRHHKETGLPARFPLFSAAIALVFISLIAYLLSTWAMDWSLLWAAAMLFVLAGSYVVIAIGLIAYTEAWQTRSVVDYVRSQIEEALDQELIEPAERNRVPARLVSQGWGSAHCLRIIQGYYDEAKLNVLKEVKAKPQEPDLKAYCGSGELLGGYLSLKWPAGVLDPRARQRRRLVVAREAVTILLSFEVTDTAKIPVRKLVETWVERLRQALKGDASYQKLLLRIFALARAGKRMKDADETRTIITEITNLYRAIESSVAVLGDTEIDCKELCSNTWLALAPRFMNDQACFDVWMTMMEGRGDLDIQPSSDMDPAKIAARISLARLYESWSRRTNLDWDGLLSGRALYAKRVVETASRVLSEASQ